MVRKSDAVIRIADQEDFEDILRLYKAGLEELGFEYKESLLVRKIFTSFQLAPCFLLEIDGKIRGMAGFTVTVASHSGVSTLSDYLFYIEPEYRTIDRLGGLVGEAKAFAKSHNLPLRVDFLCHGDEKAKMRLLRRNGFRLSSVVGMYNE